MSLAIPGDSTKINKLIEQLNNKGQLCDNRNCTNNNIQNLYKFVSYWKPRDDGSQSFNPYTMFRLYNRCKDGVFNGTIKRVFLNNNHPIYEGKSNDQMTHLRHLKMIKLFLLVLFMTHLHQILMMKISILGSFMKTEQI